ncbi:hypothetical protein PO862_07870 [Rhizobium binxianense]|nr:MULTISPECIES: hypothetical protein [unclassified Rhizobium]MDC9812538.1 hypothetical protein [Rhizobium sp. MC62]WEA27890.1 hypothetical protein PO862_07870 [Rhizobium sp. MJ22]WEA62416.1 hypothetical protein PO860_07545 [Rhizobium sp. BJ04]
MAQLPPYAQRTRRPFQPDPVRHRRQPLRHPQYRVPLVPLIASAMLPRRRLGAPFLIPGCWIAPVDMISARNEHDVLLLPHPRRRRRACRFGSRLADRQFRRSRYSA